MTERRHQDRRQQTQPVTDERRHGERRTYQMGCTCLRCRSANAAATQKCRDLQRSGQTSLGAMVPAIEARRLVTKLLLERYTKATIARHLGLKHPQLKLHTEVMTVRRQLKLRRIYRILMADAD